MLFLHIRQGTLEFPVYAFQDGQYGFRTANTDSGGPIGNRLCILGKPIRNRLCIIEGPIWGPIRNRM